jgi:hypothetical protein
MTTWFKRVSRTMRVRLWNAWHVWQRETHKRWQNIVEMVMIKCSAEGTVGRMTAAIAAMVALG